MSSPNKILLNENIKSISPFKFDKVCQESTLSLQDNNNSFIPLNTLMTLFASKKKGVTNIQSCIIQNGPILFDSFINRDNILYCFTNKACTEQLLNFLNNTSKEMVEYIISELNGTFRGIIKDKNGNVFCCELFKICEENQRIKILNELSDTMSEDCCNKYASYPLQVLIEFSSCEKEYKLILNSFNDQNKLLYASLDPIGSYVIKKIIEHIPEKFRIQFNLQFIKFITFISMKKYGLINAKKFITFTKNEENIKRIINLVLNNFINIATNNYGNYLIQYILEKWHNISEINDIKVVITDNFLILVQNRYSAFICDLFIKMANIEEKKQLITILNFNWNNNIYNINNNNNNNNIKNIMIKINKSFETKKLKKKIKK